MDAKTRSRLEALQFRPNGAVQDKALHVLQRNIGNALPADYLDFLGATGGGPFVESVVCRCRHAVPIVSAGVTPFGEFLGLAGEESVYAEWRRMLNVGVSRSFVPIADAAGGDYYCLNPAGAVVYWDHDSGKSYLVADSFFDLVTRLEADTERPDVSDVDVRLDPDLL